MRILGWGVLSDAITAKSQGQVRHPPEGRTCGLIRYGQNHTDRQRTCTSRHKTLNTCANRSYGVRVLSGGTFDLFSCPRNRGYK